MNEVYFGVSNRKNILYIIIITVISVFSFKLFYMQIVDHQVYDQQSAGNSIKGIEQIPLRGVFFDRNLNVLVSNVPAYTLRILPADYDHKLSPLLDKVLGMDSNYVETILKKNKIYSKYVPIRIRRGIDFSVVSWFEENSEYLPGIDYIVEMQRGYPENVMASHTFGYAKEISAADLEKDKEHYSPGDYVGYNGIEKMYEKDLRGIKGYNYILVDSRRKEIGKFKDGVQDKESIKGRDLVLSIDNETQRAAELGMQGKRGAVVAIEPKTGEILAMVSFPDYDLNQFSYVTTREFLKELYSDPYKPSFNRATMSLKPPGSTFKMLDAIAALDLGLITPETRIHCGGGFTFGRFFKCHGNHGSVNVYQAIEKSCNTFFYQLIYKIGLEKWKEYCTKFNLGYATGIDIGEEAKGLIPNTAYYEKIYGKNWPRSIMASLGIGQGEVSTTPLQLALYTALIANNGTSYVPHVVKGYLDDRTKQIIPLKFKEIKTGVKQSVFDVIKEAMNLVVNGAGTATHIRMKEFQIAGKTGTAQNPHGKDHALFVGFAPYEDPKIAVCVVVENIGFGGTHAAPIAKKLFEAYLLKDQNKKSEQNDLSETESIAEVELAR